MPRNPSLLLTLALCVSWPSLARSSSSPYSWRALRGLAESSDVLLVGTIESKVLGRRGRAGSGGTWVGTTDTRMRVRVAKWLVGRTARQIDVLITAADSIADGSKDERRLFFLRREGERYRLSFWSTYGVFRVHAGRVIAWVEGAKRGSYYGLSAFEKLMRRALRRRVSWRAKVSPRGKGSIELVFIFRNSGERKAVVMPPSYSFNSVVARRLRKGRWYPLRDPYKSLDHWDLLARREELVSIAPAAAHTFRYVIPRKTLGMEAPGSYEVTVDVRPYRSSKWQDEARLEQRKDIWLGAGPPQRSRLKMP